MKEKDGAKGMVLTLFFSFQVCNHLSSGKGSKGHIYKGEVPRKKVRGKVWDVEHCDHNEKVT